MDSELTVVLEQAKTISYYNYIPCLVMVKQRRGTGCLVLLLFNQNQTLKMKRIMSKLRSVLGNSDRIDRGKT